MHSHCKKVIAVITVCLFSVAVFLSAGNGDEHSIKVGQSYVRIEPDEKWVPYYGEYSIWYRPGSPYVSVAYTDSFVPVGDKEKLQTSIELMRYAHPDVRVKELAVNDMTGYQFEYSEKSAATSAGKRDSADYESKFLRVFYPVDGVENYLEIMFINSCSGDKNELQSFIKPCVLDITIAKIG